MKNEITPYVETPKKSGILTLLKRIFRPTKQEPNSQTEILLSNEEVLERVATLYFMIKENGERTVKSGNNLCRIFINQRNNSLEFRIGKQAQIMAENFSGLSGLETLLQVSFGVNGEVFSATFADLAKQTTAMLGSTEYDSSGTVYGQKYIKGVEATGAFTQDGPRSATLPEEMRETLLLKIFEPINNIIRELTEGVKPNKVKITKNIEIE